MQDIQKILLLDDNKDLCTVLQIILKGQGYDTLAATNIDEAVTKIRVHKPALILMDVFMGDTDGREFCSLLKAHPDTEHIRIIMMSGCDATLGLMKHTHADDFMQKPFDYTDLLQRVERQMTAVHSVL